MTTKRNYSYIPGFILLSFCSVILIVFSLYVNNWKIDEANWKGIVLFILIELLNIVSSFLTTHGGFLTDTVTINEEGIIFKLRKETLSYNWEEIEQVRYYYGRGGHTFFVFAWNRPAMSSIRFTCSKEFKEYFFKIYPNIQK